MWRKSSFFVEIFNLNKIIRLPKLNTDNILADLSLCYFFFNQNIFVNWNKELFELMSLSISLSAWSSRIQISVSLFFSSLLSLSFFLPLSLSFFFLFFLFLSACLFHLSCSFFLSLSLAISLSLSLSTHSLVGFLAQFQCLLHFLIRKSTVPGTKMDLQLIQSTFGNSKINKFLNLEHTTHSLSVSHLYEPTFKRS